MFHLGVPLYYKERAKKQKYGTRRSRDGIYYSKAQKIELRRPSLSARRLLHPFSKNV